MFYYVSQSVLHSEHNVRCILCSALKLMLRSPEQAGPALRKSFQVDLTHQSCHHRLLRGHWKREGKKLLLIDFAV